jgi:hypothetical protein
MIVLFDDQSKNLQAISPYEVEFRLIRPGHPPAVAFASHATDLLNYLAGAVRVIAPTPPAALPPALPRSLLGRSSRSTTEPNTPCWGNEDIRRVCLQGTSDDCGEERAEPAKGMRLE